MNIELKTTPKGKTYWASNAAYSEELKFHNYMAMLYGEEPTVFAELIRCANSLSYEFYNNANCNVMDSYRTKENNRMRADYKKQCRFMEHYLEIEVEKPILEIGYNGEGRFYVDLMDKVMHYIISNRYKNKLVSEEELHLIL